MIFSYGCFMIRRIVSHRDFSGIPFYYILRKFSINSNLLERILCFSCSAIKQTSVQINHIRFKCACVYNPVFFPTVFSEFVNQRVLLESTNNTA
jgi:hypothetical protein